MLTLLASALLSFLLPVLAYGLLRRISRLSQVDAAAVAAHYGSISVVTLAVAIQAVTEAGLPYEGYIVAAAAIMEFPAILSGLWLAHRHA
ncbi:MAG: sodium-dependent bicarbonate transport family permease, partial [Rickettsiales bacterium]